MNILSEKDAHPEILSGKTVAVLGYGAQGRAQAIMLQKSGVSVVVGVRENGKSFQKAQEDGLTVCSFSEASQKGDIIHILLPDEVQKEIYERDVLPYLSSEKILSFSHGFNIVFQRITPPEGVDVIMVAPKAPGTEELKEYEKGFGVPALIAVHTDASGNAKEIALSMAHAMRFTRAGVLECTFEQEAYEDLFGEQTVLCGGAAELVKTGFEVLTEAGYPPEMAYFECLHELKLIVDLMYEGGIEHMYDVVSNTAEFGGRTVGPKIIDAGTKERMKEALKAVETGKFAKDWMEDYETGLPLLTKLRKEQSAHPIEETGRKVRGLFRKG
ncbi:ketol-acid reductoisomerase [Candidatus Peregrinibacteria bacterium]|nr:MAG: ketol-acid reductoisomerase [Candidatus Peregrinibacteria bacterium]